MSQAGKLREGTALNDVEKLTSNIGGAIGVDAAFNINVVGGNNITGTGVAGTHTITFNLTGTTNHSLQLGNATGSLSSLAVGTTGTIVRAITGADPAWTTATYPNTAAVGDIIYGSALNTITGLAFVNTATRYLANTGTGATLPEWAQVNLTNGVTGVLPQVNGGRITWSTVGASGTLVINTGIICTAGAALSFALPALSSIGDIIEITLNGSTSWAVTQAAGQRIRMGSTQTSLGIGGSLTSTAQGDSIRMVCYGTNLLWQILSSMGNITVV